jgi:hypothetical protein
MFSVLVGIGIGGVKVGDDFGFRNVGCAFGVFLSKKDY